MRDRKLMGRCALWLVLSLSLPACRPGTPTDGGVDAGDTDKDGGVIGDGDGDGDGDGCATALGESPAPAFEQTDSVLTLSTYTSVAILSGRVFDGPALRYHTEAERTGQCRRLTYTPSPPCDPACAVDEVCIASSCVTPPSTLGAGALTLEGIGDGAVTVEPDAFGGYFWSDEDTTIGARARLSATGDAVSPFALEACTSSAPTPSSDWAAQLEDRMPGEDVTLRWSNPVASARIYLRMTTGVATHGGISPVEIECEGPDVGVLTLPGSYLDALYDGGWGCGECGINTLYRYHADEVDVSGQRVQLRVQSAVDFMYIPPPAGL